MNIYEKLQQARVELQEKNLKMGGYNKFSGFKYFELKDFLPEINSIFNKLKLFSKFDLLENEGVLTIINAEKTEEIVTFLTPKAEITSKGQNGLQLIGSTHTYLKRYCYLNALEIVEDDEINATADKEKESNKTQNDNKKETKEDNIQKYFKYIEKNKENHQKTINRFLMENSVNELSKLSTKKVKELANIILKEQRGA